MDIVPQPLYLFGPLNVFFLLMYFLSFSAPSRFKRLFSSRLNQVMLSSSLGPIIYLIGQSF